MVLEIDGSPDDWLEGRGLYLSLMGAIDDATGEVPYGLFELRKTPRSIPFFCGILRRTKVYLKLYVMMDMHI